MSVSHCRLLATGLFIASCCVLVLLSQSSVNWFQHWLCTTIFSIPAEGVLHTLGMIAVDPCDFHATQLYILAEVLVCSLSMAHEAALFSHTGRGSSLRFKYAEMGRCAGDCSVISYKSRLTKSCRLHCTARTWRDAQ